MNELKNDLEMLVNSAAFGGMNISTLVGKVKGVLIKYQIKKIISAYDISVSGTIVQVGVRVQGRIEYIVLNTKVM